MKYKNLKVFPRGLIWPVIIIVFLILLTGTFILVSQKPSLLANGADLLRSIIGDKAAVYLETIFFQLQDTFDTVKYQVEIATPVIPWTTPTGSIVGLSPTNTPFRVTTDSGLPPEQKGNQVLTPTANQPTRAPATWQPAALAPLGGLKDEGKWSQYIFTPVGVPVGYRTLLQPDPHRPYAFAGIVAFNLNLSNLHFVLGSVEPFSPGGPSRSGLIPQADRSPGVLLAMFNGGFKARQGQFGAMADGITALPPRDGLGTLAMYKDGSLRIGVWGSEITTSPDMNAFRQNGPLVIHQGVINPQVYVDSPEVWGYTVTHASPTWRSGVGLSADRKTLYYFCGPSLSVESLARSMQAAGVTEAMQLDMNLYWVHFVAVRTVGNKLSLEALFPDSMVENVDRYLWPYSLDYFYVTVKQ